MESIKGKLNQAKEFIGKFSRKTKILIGAGAVGLIGAAVIIALVMNHKNYAVLFSGISQEEATKIVGKLQETGVDFQYKDNGDILVSDTVVDQTRAELAYEGYPKSGFSYDVFIDNAGGMTTDTEKQQYKLYELQDRIGATVALFDGVKDAKVNIALKSESKYALEDTSDKSNSSSATVVVTMKNSGESPTEKQAAAIQRLVAKSVQGMTMEDVAVFDGNGIDISSTSESTSASGSAAEEIAQMIEAQISKKVVNVLAPFYGADNIRVSAKGKVNMEKVLRETTTYSTPEKIDEEDKTGIISGESTTKEESKGGNTAGGVAGTETNADTTQYNTDTANGGSSSTSESETRDYLVNQIKEQGQIDPGVLEDVTVSVSVNGQGLGSLNQNEVRALIGNAAGITTEDQTDKITIVSAPFYEEEEPVDAGLTTEVSAKLKEMLPIIAIAASVAFVLLAVLFFILKRRGDKKLRNEEAFLEEELARALQSDTSQTVPLDNPEILNLKNERSRELRERVRAFADQNPEISAQMLKTWLNGGGKDVSRDGSQ